MRIRSCENQKLQTLYPESGTAFGFVGKVVKLVYYLCQSWNSFCIQSVRLKSLLSPCVISRESQLSWNSKKLLSGYGFFDRVTKGNNFAAFTSSSRVNEKNCRCKRNENKGFKKSFTFFHIWLQKRFVAKFLSVESGKKIVVEFKKRCKTKWMKIYSAVGETKIEVSIHTKRDVKNYFHFYVVDFGYKYIYKLIQFCSTINSRRKLLMRVIVEKLRKSDWRLFGQKATKDEKRENLQSQGYQKEINDIILQCITFTT